MKRTLAIILLITTLLLNACSSADMAESTSGAIPDSTNTYTLEYKDADGGTLRGETFQSVKEGENGSVVTAIPNKGYEFVSWSDGKAEKSRAEYGVKNSISVYPIFARKPGALMDMPVIRIDTENAAAIKDKENYVTCTVSIEGTEEEYLLQDIDAGIRGRGNSTWSHHEKKSYRIKFDKKQSILGSDYKAKSWTLIANHADRTLSRNALAYTLAEQFDDIAFSSMHQHVELYLNGEYLGVYLLCDQMQTGEGRVDVDEDMTGDPDMGYLIELDCRAGNSGIENYDYFVLDHSKQYALKTPDPDDPGYDPDIYLEFIKTYMNDCLNALSAQDWEKICQLMDVDSFADVYIIQELFANHDCASFSFYFYKEKGGKLYCGPVWDFDISAGNGYYAAGNENENRPDSDIVEYGTMIAAKNNTWFRRLLRNEEFRSIVKEKLQNYEDTIKSVIALSDPDNNNGYFLQYENEFIRNFEKWNILGKYVWPLPKEVYELPSIYENFVYLRDWLTERHKLLRAEFGLQ